MRISKYFGLGLAVGVAVVTGSASAEDFYLLKEAPETMALRIDTTTISRGGVVKSSAPGVATQKAVGVTRHRLIQRRFLEDALGGKVFYKILLDEVATNLGGTVERVTAPLSGKTAVGMKNAAGNRTFVLEDGVAMGEAVQDLKAIGTLENRRWLPGRKVKVGETWEFVPAFIRGTLRRDLPTAVVVGMMTLRSVETTSAGIRQAVIDCSIRGGGEEARPGQKVIAAEVLLSGNLVVNLDQPGNMTIRLTGNVITGARVGAAKSKVKMPLTMTLKISPLGGL